MLFPENVYLFFRFKALAIELLKLPLNYFAYSTTLHYKNLRRSKQNSVPCFVKFVLRNIRETPVQYKNHKKQFFVINFKSITFKTKAKNNTKHNLSLQSSTWKGLPVCNWITNLAEVVLTFTKSLPGETTLYFIMGRNIGLLREVISSKFVQLRCSCLVGCTSILFA